MYACVLSSRPLRHRRVGIRARPSDQEVKRTLTHSAAVVDGVAPAAPNELAPSRKLLCMLVAVRTSEVFPRRHSKRLFFGAGEGTLAGWGTACGDRPAILDG